MSLSLSLRRRPNQPAKHRRATARRPRSARDQVTIAIDQLATLRAEGWTPATIALAGPDTIQRALTAASTRIETGTSQDIRRLIQPWQARALTYYDMIGEVNFVGEFYGRSLSKIRLYPGLLNDKGEVEESDDKTLRELWDRVQDPGGGRVEIQSSYGRLSFLTGEGYLAATPDPDWGEVWEFLSPDELRVQPGGLYIRYRAPQIGTEEYVNAPDDSLEPIEGLGTSPDQIIAYRLWNKHPRYSWWATSSMHAVLDVLEELLLLTLAVRSQAKSRAANNGILLWPDEMSLPGLDTQGEEDPNNDPFFEDFAASWVAPLTDPGSAGAGVPLFVRMAQETIAEANGGPRFLKFDANDAYAENGMRSELIRRYALGIDLPPEQLLGMGDSNHWSSWQVDEQTTKAHIIPRAFQMAGDFNSAYLRPAARDAGFKDWKRVVIGVDASAIINHPDRSKDAKDLHDRIVLSDSALREAGGFTDADAPNEAERAERIGIKVRDSSLAWYGIPSVRQSIEPEPGVIENAQGETATDAGATTGGEVEKGAPADGPPDPTEAVLGAAVANARIIGAAEAAVDRCRELAGSKLVTRVRNAKCQDCLDRVDGIAPALVAAALGAQTLTDLKAPAAETLVAGGARLFVSAAGRLGLNGHAAALGEMIEQHAAATLTFEVAPPLPDEFVALLEAASA